MKCDRYHCYFLGRGFRSKNIVIGKRNKPAYHVTIAKNKSQTEIPRIFRKKQSQFKNLDRKPELDKTELDKKFLISPTIETAQSFKENSEESNPQ